LNEPVLVLLTLNFAFIGILPRIFFRSDGTLNARWWATASPFFVASIFLVAAYFADWAALVPQAWLRPLAVAAVPFSVASVALIWMTLGTHRVPISLWHQDNDAPRSIVTYGAYRWIRHPFYASFLSALFAALLYHPHWVTGAAFLHGVVALNLTAAREERRLAGSEFGSEYQEYMGRTGRFTPRLGGPVRVAA
jgi:protein-S-isoprenylcysteine O-methyltransferase Ste14